MFDTQFFIKDKYFDNLNKALILFEKDKKQFLELRNNVIKALQKILNFLLLLPT